jgi:PHP family Zn ribbon phosphoesterase
MRTYLRSGEFGETIGVLLGAALHNIISLAQSLEKLFDDNCDDFESVLTADESLAQLLPVAPRLADLLNSYAHSFFLWHS